MEKDRGFKINTILALLVSVVCLSIAYAQYTSVLKIQSSATLVSGAWDIYFENMTSTKSGNATLATTGKMSITSKLTVSGKMGILSSPGDSLKYTWDVKNGGKLDAVLTSIISNQMTCKPVANSNATQQQADNLCEDLSLVLTYDSVNVNVTNVMQNITDKTLEVGDIKKISLELTWKSDSDVVIDGPIEITIGSHSFNYQQA